MNTKTMTARCRTSGWLALAGLLCVGVPAAGQQLGGAPARAAKAPKARQPVDYVDPNIGVIDTDGYSNCVIGPQLPFGSINPSPQTAKGSHDGYAPDQPIRGFGQLHVSGTGWGKYGQVFLSPQIGLATGEEAHDSPKENEHATPYEYAVKLSRYGIGVAVTPAAHSAIYRFEFPKSDDAHLLLDITHCLVRDIVPFVGGKVLAGRVAFTTPAHDEIRGYGTYRGGFGGGDYNVYFCARLSQAPTAVGTWLNGTVSPDQAADSLRQPNDRVGAYFKLRSTAGKAVYLKIGVSLKSTAQAVQWLDAEIPGWNYAAVKKQAQAAWNQQLAKVEVAGGSASERRIFYTALYHALLMPRDRTNDLPDFGKDVPAWDDHFAVWDTWRTMYPLQVLLNPAMVAGTINSFAARLAQNGVVKDAYIAGNDMVEEQGGNNVDNIIADAYVKKLPGVDWNKAYEVLRYHADQERLGSFAWRKEEPLLGYYKKQGWIPFGPMAGNMTLEYAYNDFCAAEVARGLGHSADYARYLARSKKWVALWNPAAESDGFKGFIVPKTQDKDFLPIDLKARQASWRQFFYEGSSWTYSWFAPHQIDTLIVLNGGRAAFVTKLQHAFDYKLLQADNEPSFLTVQLFQHAGRPDLSSYYVRRLMRQGYTEKGYPGNEDSGAMGSWYVFSAMGIFPNAGQDLYYLTSPVFPEVKLRLPQGQLFRIIAHHASPENIYAQSVKLNGKPYANFFITHEDIVRGGVLEFEMGPVAATEEGKQAKK
ncbi:GH92 family glycosyl hydrolase [Hymenobacter sp. PAMC 26628]|uniref:GH92 family glycosyl hydrolase n=1 Tax=Hymenobacter sp. PAMC 26628 TaxID=1484118 RepID=UPI0012FFD2E8|nr:GH92 family glycosyl hydrolase [Hymenobacter sp. PAMC 26628]